MRRRAGRVLCAAAIACLLENAAFAAEPVAFSSDLTQGFARILLDWDAPSLVTAYISNGVLIAKFTRAFVVDTEAITRELGEYVSLARLDPDGMTLRLALKKTVKLHVSSDGPRVALDLLPPTFRGAPTPVVAPAVLKEKLIQEAEAQKPREPVDPAKLPELPVRVGEHAAYSRVVFDFTEKVEYSFEVGDDTIAIVFDKPMRPRFARLESDPPPWVHAASWKIGEDGKLHVDLKIDPDAGLHHFRDGTKIAFDIKKPAADGERAVTPAPQTRASAVPSSAAAADAAVPAVAAPELPAPPPGTDGAIANAQKTTPAPKQSAPQRKDVDATKAPELGNDEEAPGPPEPERKAAALTPEANPKESSEPPTVQGKEDGASETTAAENDGAALAAETSKPLEALKIQATQTANGLELVFPLPQPTHAAVFPRGNRVWIVFAAPVSFNLAEIDRRFFSTIASTDQETHSAHSVVRLTLAEATLVSAVQAEGAWTISLSQSLAQPPASITFTPQPRTVGPAAIRVTLPKAGAVVWLDDPDAGDRIGVVPALGPAHGLVTPRRFVEFTALAAAHGLAILPLADNLKIMSEGDDVTITSERGLTLSAGSVPEAPVKHAVASVQSPGFMDFEAWRGQDRAFIEERQRLLFAQAPLNANVTKARFDTARFYLANELYPEALGTLRLLAQEDPSSALDPGYKAMRGLANLMMERLSEARADLTDNALIDDPHAALWRSLLFLKLKDWSASRRHFAQGEDELGRYPPKWQARLRLGAAEAALAVNDLQGVDRQLTQVPPDGLEDTMSLEATFLRGRMLERVGRTADALASYKEVADSNYRPLAVRARLADIELRSRSGALAPQDAIVELDRLRFQWRGDESELAILRRLADLHFAQGDYRNGLSIMRAAVANFPKEELARKMGEEMATRFEELFVGGKADSMPAVQALGLYYDFKELTPIGRLGDEMIRKLADRLIAVDLLAQAAELLQHQVDNRLEGVAKASVATRLAVVYLLDRKPEKALTVIRSSRQTLLPPELGRERRLLEARALAELKQFEAALDMIDGLEDVEAQTLTADIYWGARNWPVAGAKLEAVLGDSWQGDNPLDDTGRFNVMRAAVAYSLADDAGALGRMRVKFGPKMASSPDARAFAVVTEEISKQGVDFRELARQIASIDTLEAFMAGFRERYGLGQKPPEAPSN